MSRSGDLIEIFPGFKSPFWSPSSISAIVSSMLFAWDSRYSLRMGLYGVDGRMNVWEVLVMLVYKSGGVSLTLPYQLLQLFVGELHLNHSYLVLELYPCVF